MRVVIIGFLSLLIPAALFAQADPCASASPNRLAFDPYNPSHLAIMRQYGGAALASAPLASLMQLDPYVPTEAAMLRQLGGGIPIWGYPSYPWYPPAAPAMPCRAADERVASQPPAASTAEPLTSFDEMLALVETGRPSLAAPSPRIAGSATRNVTRSSNPSRGITIQHDGRTWVSAGPAVHFSAGELVQIGERDGSPIFREARGDTRIIYIPTVRGMAAPFRVAP